MFFCISGIQTFLFILIGNAIIGVGWDMFFTWWSILWITAFVANLTGLWLSQTLNSIVAIYISIPLLLIPQILLCGLVVHFDDLNMKASQRNMVPIIGEVIPSRWAFEALVVEQFSSNAYQAKYFIVEREKFLAQYYGDIHAPEIRSAIYRYNQDTNDNEKIFIENELKILGKIARIEPYQSGDSYLDYIDKATDKLKERAHNYTAYLDQLHKEDIRNYGSDYINDLKKRNHNKAIEDMVTGIGSSRFYKKVRTGSIRRSDKYI